MKHLPPLIRGITRWFQATFFVGAAWLVITIIAVACNAKGPTLHDIQLILGSVLPWTGSLATATYLFTLGGMLVEHQNGIVNWFDSIIKGHEQKVLHKEKEKEQLRLDTIKKLSTDPDLIAARKEVDEFVHGAPEKMRR